jgi:hypothetical protein
VGDEKISCVLKRLFDWKYSGVMIPLFYGLGLAFWGLAVATDPYVPLFTAAALCVFLGLLWSVGWVWNQEFFEPAGDSPHAKKHNQFLLRRGKERKILLIATVFLFFPFVTVENWLHTSYKARRHDKELAEVVVELDERARVQALSVEFGDSHYLQSMIEAIRERPTVHYLVPLGHGTMVTNVVVKNMSDITIHNARISIMSDVRVEPISEGWRRFSDHQVNYEIRDIRPFSHNGETESFALTVPAKGTVGFLIDVDGDNVKPYGGVVAAQYHPSMPQQ